MIYWERQILPRYSPLRWGIENLFMIGKERPLRFTRQEHTAAIPDMNPGVSRIAEQRSISLTDTESCSVV
jgi:hypothetical protein